MASLPENIKKQRIKTANLLKKGQSPKAYNLLDDVEENYEPRLAEPKISICKKCKSEFEQEYKEDFHRYTDWTLCQDCLREKSKKKENKQETYNKVVRYQPHEWQKKFEEGLMKQGVMFGVISGGARSGKDYSSIMIMLKFFVSIYNEQRIVFKPHIVPSFRFWIIAPYERLGHQNWLQLVKFMPKEFVVSVSNSAMIMNVIGGGIIEVKTAYDPEALVGVGVDFAIITEAARISKLEKVLHNVEDRLNSPGVGLNGGGGKAIINSSPKGKNAFYKIFCFGDRNHHSWSGRFFSMKVKTKDNPEMAKRYAELVETKDGSFITFEEDLRKRKGRHFLADNEGEFLDSGGTVFPDFKMNCVYDIYSEEKSKSKREIDKMIKEWKAPKVGREYWLGYDPATGSSGDTPALVVREKNTNRVVNIFDLYGHEGDDQLNQVARWAKHYNHGTVCLLVLGSLHAAAQLRSRGVDVIELGEQGLNKRKYVESLQACVQAREITVLDDNSAAVETLIYQMEDYTQDPVTGKFSNQSEAHDDFVSALYAAFYDFAEVEERNDAYVPVIVGTRMAGSVIHKDNNRTVVVRR